MISTVGISLGGNFTVLSPIGTQNSEGQLPSTHFYIHNYANGYDQSHFFTLLTDSMMRFSISFVLWF